MARANKTSSEYLNFIANDNLRKKDYITDTNLHTNPTTKWTQLMLLEECTFITLTDEELRIGSFDGITLPACVLAGEFTELQLSSGSLIAFE